MTVTLPGDVRLDLVYIPPGTFQMGSGTDEAGAVDDEYPRHKVTIPHGFWMGKYEVTKAQWGAVMTYVWDDDVSPHTPATLASLSSHDYAEEFVAALSAATGLTFRLPSEAEWEYACRAGSDTRYFFGDDEEALDYYAWYGGGFSTTKVVGQLLPNEWGLYDIYGNVAEWCADAYHDNYQGAPTNGSAWTEGGSWDVARGGAIYSQAEYCRSACRRGAMTIVNWTGLRVILEL